MIKKKYIKKIFKVYYEIFTEFDKFIIKSRKIINF
jgi:hypothetical protein